MALGLDPGSICVKPSFLYPHSQQTFLEHLLCAWHDMLDPEDTMVGRNRLTLLTWSETEC